MPQRADYGDQRARGILHDGDYNGPMGWARARLLAYKNEWYDASLDHEGPACYEIGTGGPRGGNIEWHYA